MSANIETARLLFDGARLAQARTYRGLLKGELATAVGVSPAAVGQFEAGASRPSGGTLARLAMALGVPVAFFAADRPRFELREEDAHFRSLRSTSKRDRSQARTQVELLAETVALIEQRVRLPEPALPSMQIGTKPEDAAREVRRAWELGDGPISNVVGVLERRGSVVARLPAATEGVDAFSCWIGRRPFVILTSNKGAADRSRFDAAHELGHLLLHADARPGDPEVEREANRFAAEFLTPASSIARELPRRVDWRALSALKIRWRVAISMLLMRARDVGVISDAAYRRAMVEMSRRGWRKIEPAPLGEPERPELLGLAMGLLESRRALTTQDVSDALRLGPETLPFSDLLSPIERLAV